MKASHPLPDMTGMNNRDRMVKTAAIGDALPSLRPWIG